MVGRKTRSTNEILVDILNELAEHTDSEHGLTVKELSNRVGATEKTVHAHLQLLDRGRHASGGQCRCVPRMVHGTCDRRGRAASVR